jgi:uncharacterized protein HI_1042
MCRLLPSAVSTSPTRASNYFTLDRIDEDQAQDYAKRKGWDEREMIKWLGGGDEVILIIKGVLEQHQHTFKTSSSNTL